MTDDNFKGLNENLTQVRLDIRELMTEVRSLKDLQVKVGENETKLIEVDASTKSAHKRLDSIDKIIFWISTTIIGAVVIAILTLVITRGGK